MERERDSRFSRLSSYDNSDNWLGRARRHDDDRPVRKSRRSKFHSLIDDDILKTVKIFL